MIYYKHQFSYILLLSKLLTTDYCDKEMVCPHNKSLIVPCIRVSFSSNFSVKLVEYAHTWRVDNWCFNSRQLWDFSWGVVM